MNMILDSLVSRYSLYDYLKNLEVANSLNGTYRTQELTEVLRKLYLDYISGDELESYHLPIPLYYMKAVEDLLHESNILEVDNVFMNNLTDAKRALFVQRILETMGRNISLYEKVALGAIIILWLLWDYTLKSSRENDVINRWIGISVRHVNLDSQSIPNKYFTTTIHSVIHDSKDADMLVVSVEILLYCFLMTLPRSYMSSREYRTIFVNSLKPGHFE